MIPEKVPAPHLVAMFGPEAQLHLDADRDLWMRGVRVTRAGGWLRVGSTDEKIPRVLQWIAVHLRVEVDGARTKVSIDGVRFGDVEWNEIRRFHDQFDGVWAPHLVERTRRALLARSTGEAMVARKDTERDTER